MKAEAWTKRSDEMWSNVFTLCALRSSVVNSAGFGLIIASEIETALLSPDSLKLILLCSPPLAI
jgi:hypothetical protein